MDKLDFVARDFKGSRYRCLTLTALPNDELCLILNKLIYPYGNVTAKDRSIPQGFLNSKEAELNKVDDFFLTKNCRDVLKQWWLKKFNANTRTPVWDLISTCKINNKHGLLLVEAKAHLDELNENDKCKAGKENYDNIKSELDYINKSAVWKLSTDSHYQLSNRLAWAWKLTSMGVPVILIYLGFLNAKEMIGRKIFNSHQQWEDTITKYSTDVLPSKAWNKEYLIGNDYMRLLIKSIDIKFEVY